MFVLKICVEYATSISEGHAKVAHHRVYKTPWQGDTRVNIQNDKGKAKVYQVKQVLLAIGRLENNNGS